MEPGTSPGMSGNSSLPHQLCSDSRHPPEPARTFHPLDSPSRGNVPHTALGCAPCRVWALTLAQLGIPCAGFVCDMSPIRMMPGGCRGVDRGLEEKVVS